VANDRGDAHATAEAAAAEWAEAALAVEEEPPPVGWSPRDVATLRLLVALVRCCCAQPKFPP
jgi:hypothetical protein